MSSGYKSPPPLSPRCALVISAEAEESDDATDRVYDRFQANLADLGSPSRLDVLSALDWLEDSLPVVRLVLPDRSLDRLLELLGWPDAEVVRQASHVISMLSSFPSVMIGYFLEHGLLDFIGRHFPDFGCVRLYRMVASNSSRARDVLLDEGYLGAIESLFASDDATDLEIVTLCRSVVMTELEFDPHGPSVFSLFLRIADFPPGDPALEVELAAAFVRLLRANDAFPPAFVAAALIPRFLQSPCGDPGFVVNVLAMLSVICNAGSGGLVADLLCGGALQFAAASIQVERPAVAEAAVELISDIVMHHPQAIDRNDARSVPARIANLFGSDVYAGVKQACVHFTVVTLALSSERKFDELVHNGCLEVLLTGIELVQADEVGFVLRILIRGHRAENPNHAARYKDDLRSRPHVVAWLEAARAATKVEHAEMAAQTLNLLFPLHRVDLESFQ
jgi:hypothetical protein